MTSPFSAKGLILLKKASPFLGTTQAEHAIKSMVRWDDHENIGKSGTLSCVLQFALRTDRQSSLLHEDADRRIHASCETSASRNKRDERHAFVAAPQ